MIASIALDAMQLHGARQTACIRGETNAAALVSAADDERIRSVQIRQAIAAAAAIIAPATIGQIKVLFD